MKSELGKPLVNILGIVNPIWADYIRTLPFDEDDYRSSAGRTTLPINYKISPAGSGKHRRTKGYRNHRINCFLLKNLKHAPFIGLALNYEPRGKISPHRDGNGYGPLAISVSDTDYYLGLRKDDGEQAIYFVGAHQLISFPSKLVHWAWHKGDHERFALIGWHYDSRGYIKD